MSSGKLKKNIRKKKLGAYPYASVLFSITLALFVMGLFGLILIYSQELEKSVRSNIKIQVFLKNHLTEEQKKEIGKKIATAYFLPKVNNRQAVQFYAKEDAAKQFIKETGEDFQKFLGENPLRDAYLVRVDPIFHGKDSMRKLKASLEKINGVFQVYYVESLIESINDNIAKIALILLSITAILLFAVMLLINNTLRLALFSQRFLIRSMQLVGATKWFIQRPFLVRASIHGLVSGVIASGLLASLIYFATKRISDLSILQNQHSLLSLFAALLVMGVLLAILSTFRAVRKYLKLSLDELY
jgi:cell division transport system permease protein